MNALDMTPVGLLTGMYDAGRELGSGHALSGLATAALTAAPIPGGRGKKLAMDEASRMLRAREMGYSPERFWRGDAGSPANYPKGGHFSRDAEYAGGFAEQAGQAGPREFRLNLQNAFSDDMDVTADQFSRIVHAAEGLDKTLAQELVASIAPGKSPEWLRAFADRNPDMVVATEGGAAAIRQALSRSSAPEQILLNAGFDAIDSGRDVRKLKGEGIRHAEAAFDPAKVSSTDIFAGLGGASILPFLALRQDEEDERY